MPWVRRGNDVSIPDICLLFYFHSVCFPDNILSCCGKKADIIFSKICLQDKDMAIDIVFLILSLVNMWC